MALVIPRERSGIAWGWVGVWLAFVGYAVFLAPPDDPALTRALVRGTFTGRFAGVDASVAAVFSMLGVVPVLASSFVLRDGACRRVPAWPFALGMFVVGAFALVPWLALRCLGGPRAAGVRPPGPVRRLLANPSFATGIIVALVALGCWALAAGHAGAYAKAFRTTSMVNVMTVDLALCAALVAYLVEEARASARPSHEPALARTLRFVPLLGSAAWNALVRRAS